MISSNQIVSFPFNVKGSVISHLFEGNFWFEDNQYLIIRSGKCFKRWDRLTSQVVAESQPLEMKGVRIFGNFIFVFTFDEITLLSLQTLEVVCFFSPPLSEENFFVEDLFYRDGTLFVVSVKENRESVYEDDELNEFLIDYTINLFSLTENADGDFDGYELIGNWNTVEDVRISSSGENILLGFDKTLGQISMSTKEIKTLHFDYDNFFVDKISDLPDNNFVITTFGSKDIFWRFEIKTGTLVQDKKNCSVFDGFEVEIVDESIFRASSPLIEGIWKINSNADIFFSHFEKAVYLPNKEGKVERIDLRPLYKKRNIIEILLKRSKDQGEIGKLSTFNSDILEKILTMR